MGLREYITGLPRRDPEAQPPAPPPKPPSQAGFFTEMTQEEILERERKKADAIRRFEGGRTKK